MCQSGAVACGCGPNRAEAMTLRSMKIQIYQSFAE